MLIEVKDDPRFVRDGADLTTELPLSFSQAALGGTMTVPTPYGDEQLHVPGGTQSGTTLSLKGKGLPRLGATGTGDLHVHIAVWTPEDLNDEQRRLFAELATHEAEGPKHRGRFWDKLKEALGA